MRFSLSKFRLRFKAHIYHRKIISYVLEDTFDTEEKKRGGVYKEAKG